MRGILNRLAPSKRTKRVLTMQGSCLPFLLLLPGLSLAQDALVASEILGRPTAHSVTLNAVAGFAADGYVTYGTTPTEYSFSTDTVHVAASDPLEILIGNLQANTRYYYRFCYRRAGSSAFITREEHTFHTQRAEGSTFRFNIEADPHMYDKKGSPGMFTVTMRNQASDSADFLLDLGDTFGNDHVPADITRSEALRLHLDYRPYFGMVCHSTPLFLCIGNHEGESGYHLLQNPPDNMAVNSTLARQFYYPNPVPDAFYSGNLTAENHGIGLPENYYAWQWGDALLVVLDAYRGYTSSAKPRGWDWTLGTTQYAWFKQTLESSAARYKFVFIHQVLGETRGGVSVARFYEWGGYEGDSVTYGFAAKRPGWTMPIHQLMVKNGVRILFHGHDHLYAKESLDGIVYQEVPMPSDSTYDIGTRDNANAYRGDTMSSSGHLRVTVAPAQATVEYVRAWMPKDAGAGRVNGSVAASYSLLPVRTAGRADRQPEQGERKLGLDVSASAAATKITFSVPQAALVGFAVYDVGGRLVHALSPRPVAAGSHTVDVSERMPGAKGAGTGVRIVRMSADRADKSVSWIARETP